MNREVAIREFLNRLEKEGIPRDKCSIENCPMCNFNICRFKECLPQHFPHCIVYFANVAQRRNREYWDVVIEHLKSELTKITKERKQ